jgi:hypothetical protein
MRVGRVGVGVGGKALDGVERSDERLVVKVTVATESVLRVLDDVDVLWLQVNQFHWFYSFVSVVSLKIFQFSQVNSHKTGLTLS